MKRKTIARAIGVPGGCALIGLGVFFAWPGKHPDTLFSISQKTTPAQLKARGFVVNQDRGSHFLTAYLDGGMYLVTIHYDSGDTFSFVEETITIDYLKFEEMTGLEPTPYASVIIDGANYRIVQLEEEHALQLTRLGL
jgi:predicted RNA binding protein YcfA (HicA-like mRNA interferase family)